MIGILFWTKSLGYALYKEVRRYLRGLKHTSNFYDVLLVDFGLKKKRYITLRDGFSLEYGDLYWGLIYLKDMMCKLTRKNGRLHIYLPHHKLRFYLTSIHDLFIVSEVFGDEVYRPLSVSLKGGVVVDVGSFIGISPAYFALYGAKVFAYEPLPLHYDFARMNLEINCLINKVVLYKAAVGGATGKVLVPSNYSSYSYSLSHKVHGVKNLEEVDVLTLSDVIKMNNLEVIDLLKIDCEGCENEIFENVENETLKRIKEIIIEYHSEAKAIIETLRRAGFECVKLKRTIRARNRLVNKA